MTEQTTPLTLLKLTDGRLVPYDKERVATGILAASQAVGRTDPLWPNEVAEAVTVYLRRQTRSGILTEKELEEAVVKTLLRTGHIEMAKAYVLYRSQRRLEKNQRLMSVSTGLGEEQGPSLGRSRRDPRRDELLQLEMPEVTLELDAERRPSILVRDLSGELIEWRRADHLKTLTAVTGLAPSIADHLIGEIHQTLERHDLLPAPLILVLYLQAVKLIELDAGEEGLVELAALPIQLIAGLLGRGCRVCNDGAHSRCDSFKEPASRIAPPAVVERVAGNALLGEYALIKHYPKAVAYAHYSGELHLERPWTLNRPARLVVDAADAERLDDLLELSDYCEVLIVEGLRGYLENLSAEPPVYHRRLARWLERCRSVGIPLDGLHLEWRGGGPRRLGLDFPADGVDPTPLLETTSPLVLRRPAERHQGLTASRVAVNLHRCGLYGVERAAQLGVEAVKHAIKAARAKKKFLRRLVNRSAGGLLGPLIEHCGRREFNDAGGSLEVDLYGLDRAVFRLCGEWPAQSERAAGLLRRLAEELVGGSRRLSRERNIELTLHARADSVLDGIFDMLDRTVLGLDDDPQPPSFNLPGGPEIEFHGPYAPAYPPGVAVELQSCIDPDDLSTAARAAAAVVDRLVVHQRT